MKSIDICGINASNKGKLFLIAGPCQIESRDHSLMMADKIANIAAKLNIPYVFKSSFDKANRTSIGGKRGIGLDKSLAIFREIKETLKLPILTDVHKEEHCEQVSSVVDVLQIPAFLCRQTDLLEAAANTGKVVNVKKGQFLAPEDVKNIVKKIESFGNEKIILTERGSTFGYNNLVVDMRSFPIMASNGYPVVFDATHSTQQPGGLGSSSGGNREMVPYLSRSAVACGIAGIFMEVHDNPDVAPSDGPCMVKLSTLEQTLKQISEIDKIVKEWL